MEKKFNLFEIENYFMNKEEDNQKVIEFKKYIEELIKENNIDAFKKILLNCHQGFKVYTNVFSYLTSDIKFIKSIIDNENEEFFLKLIYLSLNSDSIELTNELLKPKLEKISSEKTEKLVIDILNKKNKKKYFDIIEKLIKNKKISLENLANKGFFSKISDLESFEFFHGIYPDILDNKYSTKRNILNYAFNRYDFKLVSRIVDLQPNLDLNSLEEENKEKLLSFLSENNGENNFLDLKNRVINDLFNDENIYIIKNIRRNNNIINQGKDQIFLCKSYKYKNDLITSKYIGYAILKNDVEHNIKLYDIKYNADNNKTITYYKFGTDEILATLVIKDNELNFDFGEGKGLYDDPNFQKYVDEILNANFESMEAFNYELSYLAHSLPQYQQYQKGREEERKKYVYMAYIRDDEKKAEIINRSLKEKDKTFICGFDYDRHSTQVVINNGSIAIPNTGGAEFWIYRSFMNIIEYIYKLNPENYEIKKLYEEVERIKRTVFSPSNKKEYDSIVEYIENNKDCPIKILHCRNIEQSCGNCALASKLNMALITKKYYEKYGELQTLSERLNKLEVFFNEIEKKETEEEKINYIKKIEKNDNENYGKNVELIDIISEASSELLWKGKHFAEINRRFGELRSLIITSKSKINISEHDKIIKNSIDMEIKKMEYEYKMKKNEEVTFLRIDFIDTFIEQKDYFSEFVEKLNFLKNSDIMNIKMQILLTYIKYGHEEYIKEYIKELNKFANGLDGTLYEGGKNKLIKDNLKKIINENFKKAADEGDIYAEKVVSAFEKEIKKVNLEEKPKIKEELIKLVKEFGNSGKHLRHKGKRIEVKRSKENIKCINKLIKKYNKIEDGLKLEIVKLKKSKESSEEFGKNGENSKKHKQYTFIEVEDFNKLVNELRLEKEVEIMRN